MDIHAYMHTCRQLPQLMDQLVAKLKEQLEAVKKSLATLRIDDHDFDTH